MEGCTTKADQVIVGRYVMEDIKNHNHPVYKKTGKESPIGASVCKPHESVVILDQFLVHPALLRSRSAA